MTVLLGEALHDVEVCSGVRCDGFSSSVYNIIGTIKAGAALCIFNFGLTQLGYVAPGILRCQFRIHRLKCFSYLQQSEAR